MQLKWLRRLRLWASPVEMFEVAEEGGRRCPPQKLYPRLGEKSPRAMLLCACLGWRRDTATPRLEHQMFESKGPQECRHCGAPRTCIKIACRRISRCTCGLLAIYFPEPSSYDGLRSLDELPARCGIYGWSNHTSHQRSRKYELVKSFHRVHHFIAHCTSPSVSSKRQRIVEHLEVERYPSRKYEKYQNCRRGCPTVEEVVVLSLRANRGRR